MFDILNITSNTHRKAAELYPELVPSYNHSFPGRNVVLFGSFSPQNWERMRSLANRFARLGFFVLAPRGSHFVDGPHDFPILDSDMDTITRLRQRPPYGHLSSEEVLEVLFQKAMDVADINYLVTDERDGVSDGGYMGLSAAREFGRIMDEKPVFADRPVSPTLDDRDGYGSLFAAYVSGIKVATPEELACALNNGCSFVVQDWSTRIEQRTML